jgi:hypothetical protein
LVKRHTLTAMDELECLSTDVVERTAGGAITADP